MIDDFYDVPVEAITQEDVIAEIVGGPEPVESIATAEPVTVSRDSVGLYLGPPTSGDESFQTDAVRFLPAPPAVRAPQLGGSQLDAGTLTSLYLQLFGRPPDANEMASDLDNARRYGDAGVIRGIQLRAGNVAGSGIRGDEGLPSLQQDNLVMTMNSGGASQNVPATFTPEGWRDILGGIVSLIPVPGAPQLGDIIAGSPSLAQPRLPMPAPRPQLPAPRTPPIIDVPIPSRGGGGMSRAGRAAAIAAAAAALGLSVEQYLAMHPELRRRRRMNVLNQRALRRAFTRVHGFGQFVKRTIHLEKHAPRPKRRGRKR